MQLSQDEFDRRYADGQLRLAFVGMSNIGKSYTANRMAKAFGFDLIEIDKIIWENLGEQSMADFARWQGQPYSDGYAAREARSIQLESDATRQAMQTEPGNALLDTTGSVIYVASETLNTLKQDWLIVHIMAEEQDLDRLKRDYFDLPKPLIWREFFKPDPSLSPVDNIRQCYPDLLDARRSDYAALADVSLTSSFVLDPNVSPTDIFEAIRAPLA